MKPLTPTLPSEPLRCLTAQEILTLEKQGCSSPDWGMIRFSCTEDGEVILKNIRNVRFSGKVDIGHLDSPQGRETGILNCRLSDCVIGDNVFICNIGREIKGIAIGCNARIENTAGVSAHIGATCGLGVPVAVLDETGSRPVPLFPSLSSNLASLMARFPRIADHHILPILEQHWMDFPYIPSVGDDSRILDCGLIEDVYIGPKVNIEGASRLKNGIIISHISDSKDVSVGTGTDAEDFCIVDGRVDGGAFLRRVFVGQGAHIGARFTAHDSLFFANCTMENGEACSILAGPYTVSMHKSTLLIGAEYSFMNAGSGTNSSNHMYKLGPVHWGMMERGVKTSSGAYIMWDGKIGAFSLVMGQHKTHPDTSDFPFSYLFGTERGETAVSPGIMLRSCGLMRDEQKWPARDRRKSIPAKDVTDAINFDVLNPFTVGAMLRGLQKMRQLCKKDSVDNRNFNFNGSTFSSSGISRGIEMYELAIVKYLHAKVILASSDLKQKAKEYLDSGSPIPSDFIDLGGFIYPHDFPERFKEVEDYHEIQRLFIEAKSIYPVQEYLWAKSLVTPEWEQALKDAPSKIARLQTMIDEDREKALANIR